MTHEIFLAMARHVTGIQQQMSIVGILHETWVFDKLMQMTFASMFTSQAIKYVLKSTT